METTRTSGSSIANSLGIGSGVDMVSLAEELARAQFEPRQQRLAHEPADDVSFNQRLRALLRHWRRGIDRATFRR